jgi:aminopeptidase N
MARTDFDLRNPNRVRALAASFAMSNPVAFHAADGWGYRFLADLILKVDPLNPALSARLSTAFESWRSFSAERRKHANSELKKLSEAGIPSPASPIGRQCRRFSLRWSPRPRSRWCEYRGADFRRLAGRARPR